MVGSGLTQKYLTILEKVSSDKHSSLFLDLRVRPGA